MSHVRSYRDLKAWQLSMGLAKEIYELTSSFPQHQMYGLACQMQRAVVSIASNIAEGHERQSTKEFLNFLSIARGSLAELETQLMLAESLGYAPQAQSFWIDAMSSAAWCGDSSVRSRSGSGCQRAESRATSEFAIS